MRGKRLSIGLRALAIFAVTLSVTSTWAATNRNEKVLHNFGNGTDGTNPFSGLILDAAGNLYGTTQYGGNFSAHCSEYGCGMVFELTPNGSGGWTETVLYSFCSQTGCTDGSDPTAGLIFDAGNLYGTTYGGGAYSCQYSGWGCGTVFELTPTAGGGWTETVLHNFGNGTDGYGPQAGLIFDAARNLYGTTVEGGTYAYGTVFKLTPAGTETVLYSFQTNGPDDGAWPVAGLIFDAAGNLYGTTLVGGGSYNYGTAFELTPTGGGSWTETVLHSFTGGDGTNPYGDLIFDAAGNLYGTTVWGGYYYWGTAFELTPNGSGGWTETVLYSFGNGTDGAHPYASLIFDAAGNLYGTTYGGGSDNCTSGCGTVFELTPAAGGRWTEQVLHNFGNGTDGVNPWSGLIIDAAGNLYGTTGGGGTYSQGTVFELTPIHPCVVCSHSARQ